MQLTRYTDYSLRVLIYLALVEEERRVTMREIVERFNISHNHLVKIVQRLARLGLVATTRGKSGGIRLARPAESIGVGEVVRLMETNLTPVNCTEPRCPMLPECRLQDALGEAMNAFLAVLDRHTIADLVNAPTQLRQLLA